jgi:cyclopropane fatty-acyl-phospholipid synthase-like methyltransferase
VLVSLGLLRVEGGRYRATTDAARFLDARSPESLLGARRFLAGPPMTEAFAGLAATLRRRPTSPVSATPRFWREFAETMWPVRRLLARAIADDLRARDLTGERVLDVGGGASPVGLELLKRRRAASLVVLDHAEVVGVARRHARAAAVSDRVRVIAGDSAVVAWGGPYDLILTINVLEYVDSRARALLARKAFGALAPGGTLVIHAPLLDRSRTSPPDAVAYDLMLLALGAKGRASTFQDIRDLCRSAGFSSVVRSRRLPLVLARRSR